ncbi:MAG: glucokinase [Polyangiales bacterium]
MSAPLLIGDVGGTKTILRLIGDSGETLANERFDSKAFGDLNAIVQLFLEKWKGEPPKHAAFGIAGPVVDGVCKTTNLPWHVDEKAIAQRASLTSARLLNDFESTAWGVLTLPAQSIATLQVGEKKPHGAIAVIGAGTGLGEAMLVWNTASQEYQVVASEGGHADYAPRDETEIELLRWLKQKFGRVSWERVVSGTGLANIYQFLRESGAAPESAAVRKELDAGRTQNDWGPVIGKHASAGDDVLSVRAVDLFVTSYGAEAGNLALKALATGGVYVTGGIAPKTLKKLQDGSFMRAFRDKGRLGSVVDKIPVHVVLDPEVALLGALYVARSLSQAR